MFVLDADAHVEESPATFADPHLDPDFAERRPAVVSDEQSAYWLIDGRAWPRRRGHGAHHFATPTQHGSMITSWTASKPEPLESITLADVGARVRQIEAEKIDLQVIYPTLFLAHPLTDDAAFQTALVRCYNSWVAEVCGRRSDKLKWVGLVNLEDAAGAAAEVERVRGSGGIGVMTLGTVGDRKLDDPRLDPFYAALCQQRLPLAVHVGWPSPSLAYIYEDVYDALVLPFTVSMFTGFLDIVGGGVLDRFPDLKVAFFEAGCEWIPFLLDRMDHYYEIAVERKRWAAHTRQAPSAYVRSGNVYFGYEVEDELLPYVLKKIGEDQFVFASDIPHGDRFPAAVDYLLGRQDLSETAKKKLLGENALRFYGL